MRSAIALCFGLGFGLAALGGCSSGTKAYIPVDSPLRTWTAPEADAFTPDPATPAPAPKKAEKKP